MRWLAPSIAWDVSGNTGAKHLMHDNARNPDVAVIFNQTKYYALVVYYDLFSIGIFLETYVYNSTLNDFTLLTQSVPNPLNIGWETGANCIGTVNIDALNDADQSFVIVFDAISSNLHNSIAFSGDKNSITSGTTLIQLAGVKLANPNNSLLPNEQPDVSLSDSAGTVITNFTYITIDPLTSHTKVNVLRNNEFPNFGSLDDAASGNNHFWEATPSVSYFAHPAISSNPDGSTYENWVVAVEDYDNSNEEIYMMLPDATNTGNPGSMLATCLTNLDPNNILTFDNNTKPAICFDAFGDPLNPELFVNIAWNWAGSSFYEPLAVRYNLSTSLFEYFLNPISLSPYNEVAHQVFGHIKYATHVAMGGRFAQDVTYQMMYSFYSDVHNAWCYKTPFYNDLRITKPEKQVEGVQAAESPKYQNPFTNKITLQLPEGIYTAKLYNVQGIQLSSCIGNQQAVSTALAEASEGLAQGIYLISLSESVSGHVAQIRVVKH